jgi:hypothetical protein
MFGFSSIRLQHGCGVVYSLYAMSNSGQVGCYINSEVQRIVAQSLNISSRLLLFALEISGIAWVVEENIKMSKCISQDPRGG